ncbi:MAG: glycosyltransferase family 9 protein [Rhodocyclaceae bacterium]|nr:glycosyltransferase family 9 protein [Rhodocyclaceae bacterium]MBX3669578.1 glycosyltransferase family 9 protein [Rhodocyclaceae bacterium]
MSLRPSRILLIRRDNIGDLACTTPLFTALRERYPDALLCALVTRYNRAVLDRHPALDRVYAYTKAKHLDSGESQIGNYWSRLRLMLALRRERFDLCVLAAPGYQRRSLGLARWVGARDVVGFVDAGRPYSRLITRPVPWHYDATQTETEDVWGLARAFDIHGRPGPLSIVPDAALQAGLATALAGVHAGGRRVIGIHLSARKPSQRWPVERFAALMHGLHTRTGCAFMLLWAPGDEQDPRHPGDDAKALAVQAKVDTLPVLAQPTHQLEQLIAALSLCDELICADGGAMHLAAALGKPIVCLFGKSNAVRWRPWGVPYRLLQASSQDVGDIDVASVLAAEAELQSTISSQ